jgi:hypothetical protein
MRSPSTRELGTDVGPDVTLTLGSQTERLGKTLGWLHQRRRAIAAGAGLLICTGGPSYYLASYIVYFFGSVAVLGAWALSVHLRIVPVRSIPWPVYVVAAYSSWAILSAWWSVSPNATPRAALFDAGIVAFGIWFGWRLTIDEQIWAVVLATATGAVTSALVVWLQPIRGKMYLDIGLLDEGLPWRGIFGNRNSYWVCSDSQD